MQRIFVYEYFTGGGSYADFATAGFRPPLIDEGDAMAAALASDFQAIPGTSVVRLRDARLPPEPVTAGAAVAISSARQERETFAELAAGCDWSVIIAPEQNGALWQRTRWAESVRARLLCPHSRFVSIASDKNQTADLLHQHGVAVPAGRKFQPGASLPTDFRYPAILKPADGAGSIGVQLLRDSTSPYDATILGPAARLEPLCPGIAASVAVLCGPGIRQGLPACRQQLGADDRFQYLGGSAPLEPDLAQRAQRLAQAALGCLPPTQGYVGVDLVLGPAEDGRDDIVVEINPRLTTSYIGLRHLLKTNLAAAMIDVAAGRRVELCFARQRVEFRAEGRVR